MVRQGLLSAPGSGRIAQAGGLLLLLTGPMAPAVAKDTPRLPYPILATPKAVTLRGEPWLGYPDLPTDRNIAPRIADDENGFDDEMLVEQLQLKQLSQNYRPSPALWKIGDRDTTIYLFGTIHVLPPGFAWRSPMIDQLVRRSRLLIVESVRSDADTDLLTRRAPNQPALPPLIDRVTPDHRAVLARFIESLPPAGAAMFDQMPTWIASVAVSVVRDIRNGEVPGQGADDWLEAVFRAGGKPVRAIENSQQVLARVDAIDEREQQVMLNAALDAPDRPRAEARATLHAWAKGEIGPGSPLVVDIAGLAGSTALSDPLLIRRNRAWADALVGELHRPGTVLFAAGAAHFIGHDSVIDLLRARGVKVTRVQ